LHLLAVIYCTTAVFKRWGFYWILPAFTSLLFLASALRSAFTILSQEIILKGTDLLFSLTASIGALLWFICLILFHKILVTKKEDQFSKKIFLDNSSTIFYPVRPINSVLQQSNKEESVSGSEKKE
ncbi:MAG: hypothetical protein ISR78_03280, partial [Spirochaetia bacterium]|nr:hypothetical protein [Spirochaetia bacterium]